jgi:putative PIG3 family NAD(P)H quinone oxidoreductase
MKAVQVKAPGGPEQLYIDQFEMPVPGAHEVLVEVAATAVNRADTLQRMGKYPPPAGESKIMGLEMSGIVSEVGPEVSKWKVGDPVCGLLGGGGYATHAVIHEEMALPVPETVGLIEAAAIPEVFLTAFQATRWLAKLKEGERILIHAGASGVGTAAIQLARAMGAAPWATASQGKHELCKELGAVRTIDYKKEDFAEVVKEHAEGKGVDVIIDFIGAPYFRQNLDALSLEGRLVMLGFLGGVQVKEASMGPILRKRLQIMGSTLRARSLDYKIRLSQDLYRFAWPLFSNHTLQPVIDRIFDWSDVAKAHEYMEANKNQGKIVLKIGA